MIDPSFHVSFLNLLQILQRCKDAQALYLFLGYCGLGYNSLPLLHPQAYFGW